MSMFTSSEQHFQTGASDKGAQASKKATSFIPGASLPKEVDLMTKKYQLLYYLKKQKTDKAKGTTPIYLRISCDKRVEISLNKWINTEKWNAGKQCVTGNSPEAKAINSFLKTVEVKFHEIHRNLLDKGELITADVLKSHYLGRSGQQRTVQQAFEYHLTQIKTKIGI